MIEISGLNKEYSGKRVVDGLELCVPEGELFGFLGPNGAGKTTLIKILCTLISPSSGNAYVNGYDVVLESSKVRQSLGLVATDERSFYWRLTGRQNLEFFATLHNFYSQRSRDRVDEVLDIVRLKDKADELFMGYSAGMKQRMAIARGLLNDPLVLFMDEPTRSLDPGAAQNLRDFIKDYIVKEQGKTIFLSTHNLEEAEQLCHRIAIFDEGKIKATGSSQDLKKGLGMARRCVMPSLPLPASILSRRPLWPVLVLRRGSGAEADLGWGGEGFEHPNRPICPQKSAFVHKKKLYAPDELQARVLLEAFLRFLQHPHLLLRCQACRNCRGTLPQTIRWRLFLLRPDRSGILYLSDGLFKRLL